MHRTLALALLACLAGAGCGDDDALRAGVRLRILTSEIDGPVQGRLRVKSLEGAGAFDCERLRADDPDLYVAPGAPPGRYRVMTDAGWGQLWAVVMGSTVPYLRGAGEPVTPVRMGKPYSIYVAPTDPAIWQLGEVWGADGKPSGAAPEFRPLEIETERDPEGIVALRFRPEDWKLGSVIRVLGQMTSGHVTNLLSFVVRDPQAPELPSLAMVHGAQHAPLWLQLVAPAGPAPVPDGTPAEVTLRRMPFPGVYEETSHEGTVRFEGIAALGGGLRIRLPRSGEHAAWDLEADAWRLGGGMVLLALDPQASVEVRLEGPERVVEARACPLGAALFAHAPLVAATRTLVAAPGVQEWLLRSASGAWHHAVRDPAAGAATWAPAAWEPGCRVKGSVQAGTLGDRVEARVVLEPVATPALPARTRGGFTAAVSHTGAYELSVPPGRIELQVVRASGRRGAVKTMDLRPGTNLRMDLR